MTRIYTTLDVLVAAWPDRMWVRAVLATRDVDYLDSLRKQIMARRTAGDRNPALGGILAEANQAWSRKMEYE